MVSMLATAPNAKFADLPFTSLMLISAMGAQREPFSKLVLAQDGAFAAKAVSPALTGLPDECNCLSLKGPRREITASGTLCLPKGCERRFRPERVAQR